MTAILWISLSLLVIASSLPRSFNSRFIFAGSGWIFLAIYWSLQLGGYIDLKDYVNIILVSYFVLRKLPEVADMIDGVMKMMRTEFHRLMLR